MLNFLGSGLEKLIGPWLSGFTLPLMLIIILVMGYVAFGRHDDKVTAVATNICNANWELKIRREEQDKAQSQVNSISAVLDGERAINRGLQDDLSELHSQLETMRTDPASALPGCLSQRVQDALGGNAKPGG